MTTISNENKFCFEKLIEPLVKSKSFENLYNKLKHDLWKNFNKNLQAKC